MSTKGETFRYDSSRGSLDVTDRGGGFFDIAIAGRQPSVAWNVPLPEDTQLRAMLFAAILTTYSVGVVVGIAQGREALQAELRALLDAEPHHG